MKSKKHNEKVTTDKMYNVEDVHFGEDVHYTNDNVVTNEVDLDAELSNTATQEKEVRFGEETTSTPWFLNLIKKERLDIANIKQSIFRQSKLMITTGVLFIVCPYLYNLVIEKIGLPQDIQAFLGTIGVFTRFALMLLFMIATMEFIASLLCLVHPEVRAAVQNTSLDPLANNTQESNDKDKST